MTVGLVTPRACASRTAEGELGVLPAARRGRKGAEPSEHSDSVASLIPMTTPQVKSVMSLIQMKKLVLRET